MKNILIAILLLALTGAVRAEETRTEKVNASANPADDAKPNSPAVPDVYATTGKFERIVILRFKFQSDLLAGLESMVKEQKIKNGVILNASGSVRGYHYHTVSNSTFPSKNIFVKNPDAPADIVGMSGYIMDGKIHPHISFADPNRLFGGHLEPGTAVFTFAIVTIGVMEDSIDIKRLDDKTYR